MQNTNGYCVVETSGGSPPPHEVAVPASEAVANPAKIRLEILMN